MRLARPLRAFVLSTALAVVATAGVARADWQRSDAALAWTDAAGEVVWRCVYDPAAGKPYLHPLAIAGGPSLTTFKPADHPWHYGLWFSWKYLNRVNYWEESAATGRAEGRTRWAPPEIVTHADGSARVRLALDYVNPAGERVLAEERTLEFSAPAADGGYTLDWHARFTVGATDLVLDRTPMPGEPAGQVNGGYAGLGVRLAAAPLGCAALTTDGPVTAYAADRARPAAPAVAFNFTPATGPAGSLAILSAPANAGENAPWYLVDSATMRFACAAILAPAPRRYAAGATFALSYRLALRRAPWTPADLRAAVAAWRAAAR